MTRFSRPVSSGSTVASWAARPMRRRTSVPWVRTSNPATVAWPSSGVGQRGEDADGGGLAGAVRARARPITVPVGHLEVDPAEGGRRPVALHQALCFDGVVHQGVPSGGWPLQRVTYVGRPAAVFLIGRVGSRFRRMDWTLEVVVLPVSDIDASIAFYRDKVGFDLDHDTQQRAHARRPARRPGLRLLDRVRRPALALQMEPGSMRGLQLVVADAAAARRSSSTGASSASELMVFVARRRRHVLRLRRPRRQHLGRPGAQGPGREAAHPPGAQRSLRGLSERLL